MITATTRTTCAHVADALELENARTNDGRGSSVVESVVALLRRGKSADAHCVWDLDRDKVVQYPRMYQVAVELGFSAR